MKKNVVTLLQVLLLLNIKIIDSYAQDSISTWDLQKCISYSLQNNIQIRKAIITSEVNGVNVQRAKADRFPSVNASVGQNFSWARSLDSLNTYGGYESSNSTSYGISSNVNLYNGFKTNNTIKQAELNYQAGKYDVETIKEDVSLSIVDAYLQVLYAREQVNNSEQQIEATTQQQILAEERFRIGVISKVDLQQIKAELANEKLTLANASNLLSVNKLVLMQLLELPLNNIFEIKVPEIGDNINENLLPDPTSVFQTALAIKPEIQSAGLNLESSKLDVKIAKALYQPSLSLNGGVSTGYSSSGLPGFDYSTQVSKKVNPYVGLTLSIPIYQNRQAKSGVSIARLGVQTAELSLTDEQNKLRKTIEQVCVDVISAQKQYEANLEQYNAVNESFSLISEKYNQGLVNSVDFLIEKAKLITAESSFLQSKFNLIFKYKILDFYSGKPITL